MFTFTGMLNGVDNYSRIKIIIDDPVTMTKIINDINNPYHIIEDNKMECCLVPTKYVDYYLLTAENNKGKQVTVTATPRRYSFNGKKGTTLLLKSFEII